MSLNDNMHHIISEMPVMSPSAVQLVHLIAKDEYDLEDVVRFVRLDSNLTGKILQKVNSAAFGIMIPVDTVDRAVIFLGTRTVVNLALITLNAHFFSQNMEGYFRPPGGFWDHELRTALTSSEVARKSRLNVEPDLAFTAGLLHDIGKIALYNYQTKYQHNMLSRLYKQKMSKSLEIERSCLGFDHCQVGKVLCQQWGLPHSLEACVEYHHYPSKAPKEFQSLAYIVHIGNMLAKMASLGAKTEDVQQDLDYGYESFYAFSFNEITNIMRNVENNFAQLKDGVAVF